VIDRVMKNASFHDKKMEAYCNTVRTLEDKLYSIELNHIPRKYNKEADELAKITSGRITVLQSSLPATSPNLSSTLAKLPRIQKNPRGLPRGMWDRNPWTRTPRMRNSFSFY
jgi:hypothetical protein